MGLELTGKEVTALAESTASLQGLGHDAVMTSSPPEARKSLGPPGGLAARMQTSLRSTMSVLPAGPPPAACSVSVLHGNRVRREAPRCAAAPALWNPPLFAAVWLPGARRVQVKERNLIPGPAPSATSGLFPVHPSLHPPPSVCFLQIGRCNAKAQGRRQQGRTLPAGISSLFLLLFLSVRLRIVSNFRFHGGRGKRGKSFHVIWALGELSLR